MTSYTKKLYESNPNAATLIHRQQYGAYRDGNAGAVTLAFSAEGQFGKRAMPPVLPAYECWAPELGKPKAILRAADSFAARKEYARYHQIAVTQVAARRRDREPSRVSAR